MAALSVVAPDSATIIRQLKQSPTTASRTFLDMFRAFPVDSTDRYLQSEEIKAPRPIMAGVRNLDVAGQSVYSMVKEQKQFQFLSSKLSDSVSEAEIAGKGLTMAESALSPEKISPQARWDSAMMERQIQQYDATIRLQNWVAAQVVLEGKLLVSEVLGVVDGISYDFGRDPSLMNITLKIPTTGTPMDIYLEMCANISNIINAMASADNGSVPTSIRGTTATISKIVAVAVRANAFNRLEVNPLVADAKSAIGVIAPKGVEKRGTLTLANGATLQLEVDDSYYVDATTGKKTTYMADSKLLFKDDVEFGGGVYYGRIPQKAVGFSNAPVVPMQLPMEFVRERQVHEAMVISMSRFITLPTNINAAAAVSVA